MFDLTSYLEQGRREVDAFLDATMPPATTRPGVIHEAMRYSVFAGGKRIRPMLCMAAAEAVGGPRSAGLQPGAAIELLHTYTLIHDDLPAMDDDELRRGKPTSHKVFGEAHAILAGDALLTLCFEWLASCPAPPPYPPNQLALELARASGSQGVIAGQVEDISAEGGVLSPELVDYIHQRKTGDLIRASVRLGAIAAGAAPAALAAVTTCAEKMGLAFQIADDILNVTSSAEELGKATGSDAARKKMTYVAVHGLDAARAKAHSLMDESIAALAPLAPHTTALQALARYIVERRT